MSEPKFSFEDLKVYQKAIVFINNVYEITSKFPITENYRLTSQFIKAATSVALNIAEGSDDTDAQFRRFLRIALQSLKECVVCITIANNQNYISADEYQKFRKDLTELSKMISGLRKYLKNNNNEK